VKIAPSFPVDPRNPTKENPMKRFLPAVLAAALALPALAADGAALYASKCAMCHGKDGKGTPVGQKMGAKDLGEEKGKTKEIEKVVTNGKGKMSAFKGKLTDDEIKAVSGYVAGGLK
jgi:cytochrome c6